MHHFGFMAFIGFRKPSMHYFYPRANTYHLDYMPKLIAEGPEALIICKGFGICAKHVMCQDKLVRVRPLGLPREIGEFGGRRFPVLAPLSGQS